MCAQQGEGRTEEVPVLPPADRCVVCGCIHAEVGGRRLVSQSGRGVLLCSGDNPVLGRGRIAVPGHSDLWLCLYGGAEFTDDRVRERALAQLAKGLRPWFCQRCGHRTCRDCGAPTRLPMGSDYVTSDGSAILHVAIFPVSPGCINPECRKYMPNARP